MKMKKLLITTILIALSNTTLAAKLDTKVPYPKADEGFTRQVIHLPEQASEDSLKVEILAGKTLKADCNRQLLSGELKEHTLKGWGYPYYRLDKISGPMSTLMACPGQKKEARFIPVVGKGFLLRYNSKLPIVVYVSKDVEVRYRIWSASKTVEKAISE